MSAEPLAYFGKCPVKGCKAGRRKITEGTPGVTRFRGTRGFDVFAVSGFSPEQLGYRSQEEAFRAAGHICPDHDRIIWYRRGNFSYNPDRACDGRCMNAIGTTCDCSCRGENHGRKWG